MIKFLIESSICLSLLYGVYWFFLRKEKLLGLNRYYLIGAVFFSLVIPLLEFNFTPSWVAPVQTVTNIFPSSGMANTGVLEPATKTDGFI